MGAGRKTKTLTLKEKSQPSWTANCSAPARNLRKSDLGAVIFGCKHNTFKECYFKQLFGLPAPHFAYVKNISPGLPLFLFNYSDRKLHGIFEAASPGQMNINPYGWTADASEYTPYSAQVRVQIQMQCQPLIEDQFGPIIADNYYEQRLFWFELDKVQTRKLISLFSSSPVPPSTSLTQNTVRWKALFNSLPTPNRRQAGDEIETPVSEVDFAHSDQSNMGWGSWDDSGSGRESQPVEAPVGVETVKENGQELVHPKPNFERSYSSVVSNTNAFLPQKKWSALFKTSTTFDKENEDLRARASDLTFPRSDQSNMEWESSCVVPCPDRESQPLEACVDESVAGKQEELVGFKSNGGYLYSSALTETSSSLPQGTLFETLPSADSRLEGEYIKTLTSDVNLPHSDKSNMEWGSACVTPHLDGESQHSKSSSDNDATEIYEEEVVHPKMDCNCSYSSAVTKEMNLEDNYGKDSATPFSEAATDLTVLEVKSSDLQSVVVKLMQEVEGLKASQLKQIQKTSSLELELVKSKAEIQQLKNQHNLLEFEPLSSIKHSEEAAFESFNEPRSEIDELVLIVGGFDGSSWLSVLGSYSPSQDTMKSLKPMTFVRSYASTAKLNGELYIFGGVYGDVWYDTVESYNPLSDEWINRPSLNQKKGSLAGASLYDKIFAVGGGNGVECYSEVEMFDLNIGRWIPTRSMQYKRFAPAAAEINGTLYVVGGYDGRNYLNSVERFDPREHSWTRLGSMGTKRGCHSLAVLNEKLYALGGYNGAGMVSDVEIFDPRIGSWMMGEPMNDSRGYSGAVVIGEKIYVIGGVKDSEDILDTIECYKEGYGWEVTSLKAVGKRCFFSAIVL
uniref:DCD domain-containing protein n=1 Tax=Davidia involucrata TaxID=16924 RepID=A0A5B7BIK3_DAVIN